MITETSLKNWTILNAKTGKVYEITNEDFKDLLDNGGVKLKGDYITLNLYNNKAKIWVDAITNSEYFK